MIEPRSTKLRRADSLSNWDEIILKLPEVHLLQTREWSEIKAPVGWSPLPYIWENKNGKLVAACLILKRRIRIMPVFLETSILYAPKGPLLDWNDKPLVEQVFNDLKNITKQEKSFFIKIDPDVIYGKGLPGTKEEIEHDAGINCMVQLKLLGWVFSISQIQYRNSIIIDLRQTNEQILESMKQKTRYNIHLAEKKGVVVREGSIKDSAMLYKMYAETSLRNGFTIRERKYYERVWKILYKAGMLEFLIAYYNNIPIAGLILFHFGKRAYYFYGMSSVTHREMMPTYLLQWEAIKKARKLNCTVYDLWGAPDNFNDSDPLWGVFRFKEGLGGQVIRTIGAWDYSTNPFLYKIFMKVMPKVLRFMRLRGKKKIMLEAG